MRLKFGTLCFLTFMVLVLVTSSCAINQNESDTAIVNPTDVGNWIENEQYLDISAPAGWNSFKTSDPITLLIVNNSEKKIITTENFHARIFILNKDSWIEIDNRAVYADNEYILQPYHADDPATIMALPVLPNLPDDSKSYEVRILISGSIEGSEQVIEDVVSYIDVKISP
jgi:hypothetical protein